VPSGEVRECGEAQLALEKIGSACSGASINAWHRLVAEASAHGHSLAANGAAAAQHGSAAFGLHSRAKSVRLNALAAVRLKCALGHENALL
jgi:hypothetical protein